MTTTTTTTSPELVRVGSHSLRRSVNYPREPFEYEELFPVFELELPRVGKVRAHFEVRRYLAGDLDAPTWTAWRPMLRDLGRPNGNEPRPGLYSPLPTRGIGDKARELARDACEPVIAAWLESSAYRISRREAAARFYRNELDFPRSYHLERCAQTLERLAGELAPMELESLKEATAALAHAAELLEREPVTH